MDEYTLKTSHKSEFLFSLLEHYVLNFVKRDKLGVGVCLLNIMASTQNLHTLDF